MTFTVSFFICKVKFMGKKPDNNYENTKFKNYEKIIFINASNGKYDIYRL